MKKSRRFYIIVFVCYLIVVAVMFMALLEILIKLK